MMESMVSGPVGNPDARTLAEGSFSGERMDLTFQNDGIFGVSPGDGFCYVNTVAGLHLGDAGPDSFGDARAVRSGRVWQGRLDRIRAVAHVCVVRIDADAVNAHEDLSCGGLGSGDFFKLQDLWSAEFVNLNCFHFRDSYLCDDSTKRSL